VRVWRICLRRFAFAAWTGEGAFRYGARWNSRGTRVVYTSETLALAVLEFFVHLSPDAAPKDLLACSAEMPDSLIAPVPAPALLPRADLAEYRRIGDSWLQAGLSLALRVRSVVVPGEFNLLINPAHSDFNQFRPLDPEPFAFDPRMFAARVPRVR